MSHKLVSQFSPLSTITFMPLTRYRSRDALKCFLMGCSQESTGRSLASPFNHPATAAVPPPSTVVADAPVFCSRPFLVRTFVLFISPRSLSTSLPDSSNSPMGVFPEEEEEEGRENTRAISSARHSPGDRSRPPSLSLLPGIFMADRSENGIMGGLTDGDGTTFVFVRTHILLYSLLTRSIKS